MLILTPHNFILNSAKVVTWLNFINVVRLSDYEFLASKLANLLKICQCKVGLVFDELVIDKNVDLYCIFPKKSLSFVFKERTVLLNKGDLVIISNDSIKDINIEFNKSLDCCIIPIHNDGIFQIFE